MTMISRRYKPIPFVAALAMLLVASLSTAKTPSLIGKPAPDFALKSLSGTNIRLSEYQGQVVIVNFWARWAGGSRREIPLLERIHSTYRRAGLIVLGVSVDEDRVRAMEFARTLPVTYPLMFDVSYGIGKDYGLVKLPVTYIIDRGGIVRYVHGGFPRDAEKAYVDEIRELLSE
jgi:peroxiredoxin